MHQGTKENHLCQLEFELKSALQQRDAPFPDACVCVCLRVFSQLSFFFWSFISWLSHTALPTPHFQLAKSIIKSIVLIMVVWFQSASSWLWLGFSFSISPHHNMNSVLLSSVDCHLNMIWCASGKLNLFTLHLCLTTIFWIGSLPESCSNMTAPQCALAWPVFIQGVDWCPQALTGRRSCMAALCFWVWHCIMRKRNLLCSQKYRQ